jgi:spermidine synthase
MVIVLLLLLASYPGRGRFYTRLFEVGADQTALIHESRETVVALTSVDGAPRSLWIGGEINGFYPADGTYEARALACAGASRPRRVLVVGLGGGTTAQFLAALPGVEQIVFVEILDNLARFLRNNLEQVDMALGDARVQYFVDDGRRFLYANPDERFDLISIDPLRRYTAGHNNLYSIEAMELYRDHLSPGGVLCAYADQRHIIPATMAAIFPFVDQYRIRLVVSGTQALEYDLPYMEQASRAYIEASAGTLAPAASAALDPQRVLADFLRDQGQIRIDEATTQVLTDLDPYLEYYYLAEPVLKTVRFPTEMRQAFRQRIIGCDEACEQSITSLMNRDRSDE